MTRAAWTLDSAERLSRTICISRPAISAPCSRTYFRKFRSCSVFRGHPRGCPTGPCGNGDPTPRSPLFFRCPGPCYQRGSSTRGSPRRVAESRRDQRSGRAGSLCTFRCFRPVSGSAVPSQPKARWFKSSPRNPAITGLALRGASPVRRFRPDCALDLAPEIGLAPVPVAC
jgi:hypothetical protein